jgi:hypothetical protein
MTDMRTSGGKTLEEIELLFSKDGPHPWKTRVGASRLQGEIDNAKSAQERGMSVGEYNEEKQRLKERAGMTNGNTEGVDEGVDGDANKVSKEGREEIETV